MLNRGEKILGVCCAALIILAACQSEGKGAADTASAVVQLDAEYQTIDGFGGSDAWLRLENVPDSVIELLYSQTKGIGLSILRNRIPFRDRIPGDDIPEPGYADNFVKRNADNTYAVAGGANGVKNYQFDWSNWDIADTKKLIAKINALDGAPEKLTLMSSPWTPPNNRVVRWKLDVKNWSKPDIGGRLDPAHYADYADLLADYVNSFEAAMGVPLDVLSIQNEPNWDPDYESCKWTAQEMRDFLKVLGNRFALKGAQVKVLAPEDENLKEDMVVEILADADAARVLSIVGLHQYEGAYDKTDKAGAEEMPAVLASGKRLWETEVSGTGPEMPRGDGIENALFYGRMIHYDMTLAQTNAFLYWWLWQQHSGKSNPGSLIQIDKGTVKPSKRLFVLGQYSKFVRPGWIRVGAGKEAGAGGEIADRLYISAYRAPGDSTPPPPFAVVLVNDSDSARNVNLTLDGVSVEGMTFDTYRTSETEDLKKISSKNKLGTVYCAPRSVTTVYAH